MSKGRLEAFSDGVIAIIITIMVLELVPPHGATLEDLAGLAPVFASYVLSFAAIAVYWNNHHHLLQAVKTVDGRVLWANMLLLFWLSLIPFATAWMGENSFASFPVVLYGVILTFAALAYFGLVRVLIHAQADGGQLIEAIGRDAKGKISLAADIVAIAVAFVAPLAAFLIFAAVTVMWIVPDARIERTLNR